MWRLVLIDLALGETPGTLGPVALEKNEVKVKVRLGYKMLDLRF